MCNTVAILAQALCLNAGWDALLRAGTPAAQQRDRSLPPGVAWLLRVRPRQAAPWVREARSLRTRPLLGGRLLRGRVSACVDAGAAGGGDALRLAWRGGSPYYAIYDVFGGFRGSSPTPASS
eukprot:3626492-Heterocapsa_arctica.AAC.1